MGPWKTKVWIWWYKHEGVVTSLSGFIGFLALIGIILFIFKSEPRGDIISGDGIVDQAIYTQTDEGKELRGWNINLINGKTIYISHKRMWTIKPGDCIHITYQETKWFHRLVIKTFKHSQNCAPPESEA